MRNIFATLALLLYLVTALLTLYSLAILLVSFDGSTLCMIAPLLSPADLKTLRNLPKRLPRLGGAELYLIQVNKYQLWGYDKIERYRDEVWSNYIRKVTELLNRQDEIEAIRHLVPVEGREINKTNSKKLAVLFNKQRNLIKKLTGLLGILRHIL